MKQLCLWHFVFERGMYPEIVISYGFSHFADIWDYASYSYSYSYLLVLHTRVFRLNIEQLEDENPESSDVRPRSGWHLKIMISSVK